MYLSCPTNPLKGPELSALNFARTLVCQVWLNSFSVFLLVTCNEPTVRMHRLMCIFAEFISEIYCQNLKDKTSILSLGQIIQMCYCRIHVHAHVHSWTVPCLNTFFSTYGELSYKSNKNAWAYSETQIDLWVSPTVWSGFNLLITASVSAQSDHFRCLLRFKNAWFIDSGSKHSDCTRCVFRLTKCVFFCAY